MLSTEPRRRLQRIPGALGRGEPEVGAGELVCLMGRNGVGKTTLLKTAMGLCRRGAGVSSTGRRSPWSVTGRARAGIGYAAGTRDLPAPHRRGESEDGDPRLRRGHALDEPLDLPGARAALARKGGVLSGGEQQMLAIGRALLTKPKLLMLDEEPTEGIQPSIILEIEGALRRIKRDLGLAVLLVEQYP